MHPRKIFEFLDIVPIPVLVSELIDNGKSSVTRVHRFLNLAFLEQIGYTMDEIPDIEHWFKLAYPEDDMRKNVMEEWFQVVNKSLAEGRNTAEVSALIHCKNGQKRWFTVTAQVHSKITPNMHIVAFRDIHDLKILSDENHQLSQIDQLTQVFSRRAGQQFLEYELSRFDRGEKPFSVVMCDVDYFKSINDQFGHASGDYVLFRVAETLRATCRSVDKVVRWGGDEFLLILPATELSAAAILAERLRQAVESLDCIGDRGKMYPTLSMGCAVVLPGQSIIELLKSADTALYLAKRRGRNAICTQ